MPIVLEDHGIAYYATPKVACSSVKSALFELAHGVRYEQVATPEKPWVHDHYFSTGFERLENPERFFKFAVVRDPVERFVSAYQNRVVMYKELGEPPDFSTFVRELDRYRQQSGSIEHHTAAQHDFIGGDLTYYDRVFPMGELHLLPQVIADATGYKVTLEHLHKGLDEKLLVTDRERQILSEIYEKDYGLLQRFYACRADEMAYS